MHKTPLLDQLESGPWPSFIKDLKRVAGRKKAAADLLGVLERLLPWQRRPTASG